MIRASSALTVELPGLLAPALALLAVAIGLILALLPTPTAVVLLAAGAAVLLAILTPLAALMALLVLAPLRTLIATEASFQLPLDIGQLALMACLLFWLLYRAGRKQPILAVGASPVFAPLMAFVAAGALTAFTARSLTAWLTEWLKWAEIVALVALVLMTGGEGRWQWLAFGLTLAGAANALVGVYEFLGGSGALHLLINNRFFRAFGTFGQPNPFGGFMGLLAPLALTMTLGYTVQAWRRYRQGESVSGGTLITIVYYAASASLLVGGVFMSWSRGAWLGFGASLLVMAFALPRRTWQAALVVGVIALLTGLLWITGRLPAAILERVSSATEELVAFDDARGVDITPENYAVVERLAHWQAALNMARENPWLGVGLGNYEVAYSDYRLMNWPLALGHAHNYYLNVFAEAGIIGLISYVSLWFVVILLTWRARQHPNTVARCAVLGLLGTWTYLSVHSLTDNLYVNNLFLHLGVMLGIMAVVYNEARKGARLGRL